MDDSSTSTELLTTKQVAKLLKVHPKTVLRLVKQGKLPAHRVGQGTVAPRAYRIPEAAVATLLAATAVS